MAPNLKAQILHFDISTLDTKYAYVGTVIDVSTDIPVQVSSASYSLTMNDREVGSGDIRLLVKVTKEESQLITIWVKTNKDYFTDELKKTRYNASFNFNANLTVKFQSSEDEDEIQLSVAGKTDQLKISEFGLVNPEPI